MGDLNCNDICYEITDALIAARTLQQSCALDSISTCIIQNSDIDGDSIILTASDYVTMLNLIMGTYSTSFQQNPLSDTLRVGSSLAYPGETLTLPVDLVTIDTLSAFEFFLVPNSQYLTIDTMLAEPGMEIREQLCQGSLFVFACSLFYRESPILLLPGAYHLGDLVVTVNADIAHPVTTSILFSNDPSKLLYTGLSNSRFFHPVLVNSEIAIEPNGIKSEPNALPGEITFEAYPNPFNAQTTIFVSGVDRAEIGIFDITGRRVETLEAFDGKAVWNATGRSSGLYFARAIAGDKSVCVRLTLLK